MRNGKGSRITLMAIMAAVMIPFTAVAVVVDYNTSTDRTATTVFGFQHMVTARGYGNGDVNGPGSTISANVGNGLRDGIEFSLFEYVYANDFSSLPDGALKTRLQDLHAQAVATFDANAAALVDIIDKETDNGLICGHGRWGTDTASMADSGVSPSFDFPDCESNFRNGFILEIMVGVTVNQHLSYSSYWFGLVLNWNVTTPYDFASDPNFDNSLGAVFGPDGDIDGDGITNLAEINAVNADMITAFERNYNTGTRAEMDLAYGWYIDKAILNQDYVPSEGIGPDEGEEGTTEIISNPALGFIVEGGPLTLTAPAGGETYEWYFNDAPDPITDTERITGSDSRVLAFAPVLKEDEGTYTCRYEDGAAKVLIVTPPFELTVLDAGSLPVAGLAGLGLLAAACFGTGLSLIARKRK